MLDFPENRTRKKLVLMPSEIEIKTDVLVIGAGMAEDRFVREIRLLFAGLHSEFHCFKDNPISRLLPLKKGEVSIMTNWVL